MHNMSRIVGVMTVVCVGAFALHKMQAPKPPPAAGATMLAPRVSAADVAAPAGDVPAAAAPTAGAGGVLLYPDRTAALALHLGYAVFTQQPDGSMMALPLPPHTAWQTQLALPAAGHKRLVLALSDPQCAFGVAVTVYRVDRAEPVWHADLATSGTNAKQVLDLATVSGTDPLLVGLKMADSAGNNWSCNVTLHWDDAP